MAGATLISVNEPKYTKYKVFHTGPFWAPGAYARGNRVRVGVVPLIWGTKNRGPNARVDRYREKLIADKVPFVEHMHPGGTFGGYAGPVVEFIMGGVTNGKLV